MRCTGCGNIISDSAKFCPVCGARQTIAAPPIIPSGQQQMPPPPQQQQQYRSAPAQKTSPCYVGFGDALSLYFKNYVNFKGRSTRSEFWFSFLFTSVIYIIFGIISIVFPVVIYLPLLAFTIPTMAIMFRRFHDVGLKGTLVVVFHVLAVLCFIIGSIAVFGMFFSMFGAFDDFSMPILKLSLFIMTFIGWIPFLLGIACMVICCLPSVPETNKYGSPASS